MTAFLRWLVFLFRLHCQINTPAPFRLDRRKRIVHYKLWVMAGSDIPPPPFQSPPIPSIALQPQPLHHFGVEPWRLRQPIGRRSQRLKVLIGRREWESPGRTSHPTEEEKNNLHCPLGLNPCHFREHNIDCDSGHSTTTVPVNH